MLIWFLTMMPRCVALVISLFVSLNSMAAYQSIDDINGQWKLVYVAENDEWLQFMTISDGEICLSRTETCDDGFKLAQIARVEELFIASNSDEAGTLRLKLVLGGWDSGSKAVLFAIRYHYDEGQIISGLSMVYERQTTPR